MGRSDNVPEPTPIPKRQGIVPIIYRDGRVQSEPSEKQRAKLRARQASAPAKPGGFPLLVNANFRARYDKWNGDGDCCDRQRFLQEECDHQGISLSRLPGDLDDCCSRAQLAQVLAHAYKLGILRPEVTGEG